jgi:hypothetical protein
MDLGVGIEAGRAFLDGRTGVGLALERAGE